MATAILHIGLEKTGTSSLQEFLQLNREQLLLREGIWIPDFLGRGSQWPLAVIAYADARSDDLTAPLGNAQTRLCRIEELRQQIIASVQKNPARVHCFSSEHLSSRLTSVGEITRLRDFLSPLFDDIRILLYLREPIRLAISRQSTFVKMGLGPFQLPTPRQLAEGFNFRTIIELWQSVFAGCLQVRLFDPSQPSFDLINDFCDAVGIADSDRYLRPERVNESLDWTVMRLLSRINQVAHERWGEPLPWTYLQRLVSLLEQMSNAPGHIRSSYVAPADAVVAYHAYFAEQENWLLAGFFPGQRSLWHSPYRPPETEEALAAPAQTLTISDAEEMLCRAIVELPTRQA